MANTLKRLIEKTKDGDVRMPSITQIHKLLVEKGIEHKFDGETFNVVETRIGQSRIVGDRHIGKYGKSIHVKVPEDMQDEVGRCNIVMDSSSSYYSWNSFGYANQLVRLIDLTT